MTLSNAREAICGACTRLAREGLVIGTAGNVSVRSGERVALTPTGGVFGEIEPRDVTVVDLQGNVVDGRLAPTSELALHLRVYERIDGAGAVVHTHSPMATALACVVDEVPPIHYQMLALGGAVPVAPYATFGTDELASAVVESLSGHSAVLMRNHGALCYGGDLDGAVEAALLLEWACTLYWRASMIGTPSVLTGEQLEAVVASAMRHRYGTTRALDDREEQPT
jgi:L-fuculose-phosphate aldolase